MTPHVPPPPELPPFPPASMPFARCQNRRCRHVGLEQLHDSPGVGQLGTIRCAECGTTRDAESWSAIAERRFWLTGVAVVLFVSGMLALALVYGARHQAPERVHGRSLSVPEAR